MTSCSRTQYIPCLTLSQLHFNSLPPLPSICFHYPSGADLEASPQWWTFCQPISVPELDFLEIGLRTQAIIHFTILFPLLLLVESSCFILILVCPLNPAGTLMVGQGPGWPALGQWSHNWPVLRFSFGRAPDSYPSIYKNQLNKDILVSTLILCLNYLLNGEATVWWVSQKLQPFHGACTQFGWNNQVFQSFLFEDSVCVCVCV